MTVTPMEHASGDQGNAAPERDKVDCDTEAWIQDRLETLVKMTLLLRAGREGGADAPAFQAGIKGLIQGTAIEIIRTMGREPGYVNLRPLPNIVKFIGGG